jgi:hypothetical protein
MPEPTKRPKVDRATLNFIAGVADADWRIVAAVLDGGHTRTPARKRVLGALDALGIARPDPNESEQAP